MMIKSRKKNPKYYEKSYFKKSINLNHMRFNKKKIIQKTNDTFPET